MTSRPLLLGLPRRGCWRTRTTRCWNGSTASRQWSTSCRPARARPCGPSSTHLSGTPLTEVQAHYVTVFDMKRKACPYLTYWTDGDTRNRGRAILRFKQAYLEAGYDLGSEELPDHLSVVLEFAAIGDTLTGEALLAEHQEAIHLLRDALAKMESAYVHVLDAVVATLPRLTPEIRERMAHIAASGPARGVRRARAVRRERHHRPDRSAPMTTAGHPAVGRAARTSPSRSSSPAPSGGSATTSSAGRRARASCTSASSSASPARSSTSASWPW